MLHQICKKNWELFLSFLRIMHQTHSNSPFYWNMNSFNTRSIPNYTKCILDYTRYIPKVSEMLQIKLDHRQCYSRHNPMARVNTICIPTPPRSSHNLCWNASSAKLLQMCSTAASQYSRRTLECIQCKHFSSSKKKEYWNVLGVVCLRTLKAQ